jgi:hypothetical protein
MSSIRKISVLVAGLVVLGASSASAGVITESLEKYNKKNQESEQAKEQPKEQPRSQPPAPAPRNQPSSQGSDTGPRNNPPAAAQQRNGNGGNARGNDNGPRNDAPRDTNRGIVGESLSRNFGTGDQGRGNDRNDRDNRNDRGDRGDHRGDYRPRQSHVVQTLPRGYRNYDWNGRHYYTYGGVWYEPYGSSFVSIGAPYGLFVSTLPGYSTSFYYGNSRYYYLDDTYYMYEPARRGYVVTRSPYGDDPEDDYYYDEQPDEDMYIYPAKGQSEQQQADDRYACHRWGVDQTGYDPIDDDYDRGKRGEYVRAMTACLTGRGYSVR